MSQDKGRALVNDVRGEGGSHSTRDRQARDDVAADQKHRRGVPDAVATLRRGRRSGIGSIFAHNL